MALINNRNLSSQQLKIQIVYIKVDMNAEKPTTHVPLLLQGQTLGITLHRGKR